MLVVELCGPLLTSRRLTSATEWIMVVPSPQTTHIVVQDAAIVDPILILLIAYLVGDRKRCDMNGCGSVFRKNEGELARLTTTDSVTNAHNDGGSTGTKERILHEAKSSVLT